MFCSKCGAELPDYAKFCTKCGQSCESHKYNNREDEKVPKKRNKWRIIVRVILLLVIVCLAGGAVWKILDQRKSEIEVYNVLYVNDTKIELPMDLDAFNVPGITMEDYSENKEDNRELKILYDKYHNFIGYATVFDDHKIHCLYLSDEYGNVECEILGELSLNSNIKDAFEVWGEREVYANPFSVTNKYWKLAYSTSSTQNCLYRFGDWETKMDPETFLTIYVGLDRSSIYFNFDDSGNIKVIEVLCMAPEYGKYFDYPIDNY